MGPLIPLLTLLLALAACASRPMRVLNPEDGSPDLAAAANGIRATGGGSASGRGWERRLLVSLTLRNERAETLRLAREDVILAIGPRRVSPHTLVGSAGTGSVDRIEVPAGGQANIIAQFSARFAIRKRGKIALRFEEEGTGRALKLEVPIRMRPESGAGTPGEGEESSRRRGGGRPGGGDELA